MHPLISLGFIVSLPSEETQSQHKTRSKWDSVPGRATDLSCRIRVEELVLGALPSITVQGALNLN